MIGYKQRERKENKEKERRWKRRRLHHAAQSLKDIENEADPWRSAQRGAKDAQERLIQSFLGEHDEERSEKEKARVPKPGL